MATVVKRGVVPKTPHTEFYYLDDVLALEEIHGAYGFSGPWTRKMHVRHYPTNQSQSPQHASFNFTPTTPDAAALAQPFLIQTRDIPFESDALRGRKTLVYGPHTVISSLKPIASFDKNTYFRNGEFHEIYFVQDGEGTLKTEFGDLFFRKNHYVNIPKGTTYRIDLASPNAYFLLIEAKSPISIPPHYKNEAGQANLLSPIVETEIDIPTLQEPIDQKGNYTIYLKHSNGRVTKLTLGHHPFDVCGWEGALFPFTFDILDHHGIARDIHTAPPAHNTFQSGNVPHNGFSLCSFVPQMDGWNKKDVPAPYAHSNVDSDECMFFCNQNYGARKGIIDEGSFTFHPSSFPHSPHGQAAKNSLDTRGKFTNRLAVMLDTYFESLNIADAGWNYRDKDYPMSWNKASS